MTIPIKRRSTEFVPNRESIIARYFDLGNNLDRIQGVIERIMALSEEDVNETLAHCIERFDSRHRDLKKVLVQNFMKLVHDFDFGIQPKEISYNCTLLIGAFFTMEYSFESSAYFNPSIVESPYQDGVRPGEKGVIVSFRAVGEGHVSSIVFRSGTVSSKGALSFPEHERRYVEEPEIIKRNVYPKGEFIQKLREMNVPEEITSYVDDKLEDPFIYGKLQECIAQAMEEERFSTYDKRVIWTIQWLAKSHYEITFSHDTDISERVIFPVSYTENRGIEDARFVRFVDDDGSITFYATYTAFNGFSILPRLIETKDFYHFKISPLHGDNVQNKGVAIFPKRIKGRYAMLARIDGYRNYLMFSDDVHMWRSIELIQAPKYSWEFVQMGNCGSPVETSEGWLMITHGVGPMRGYCLGATLLDLEDPRKVIGRLKDPLIEPNEKERVGYTPNVVYTCGALIHNDILILPYSMSDYATSFATIPVKDLLSEIVRE